MKPKTLILCVVLSMWIALAVTGHVSADRVPASPAPTPQPTVSKPRITTAAPTPLGTPARITPSPAETPQIQTIEQLQSAIRQRMFDPAVRHGRVGIKIVSLASGKVIFENDSDKYFMPASNMKNFTVAAALERLGPDFKFVTSVYAATPADSSGKISGDLRIFGRGDVSISTLFSNGDYYKGLDALADKIIASGVKRVDGSIVADESYFTGNPIPISWEWDDLQWYDGAEVSALPINNNAVDLNVKGGAKVGSPCTVAVLPTNTLYAITNTCATSAAGAKRAIVVDKPLGRNSVLVSGTMPASESWTGYITFTHPADLFVSLLKERLEKKGVVVTGSARTLPRGAVSSYQTEIARLESAPFSLVAAKTMKPSQNMFTEVILWTMGEEIGRKAGGTGDSQQLGVGVVKGFLDAAGIQLDSVVQYDGSGLSRHDLVTPDAVVRLYTYMAKQSRYPQAWRDSLAVGGVDGTLRNRFKGPPVANNLHGKTGTLDQVSALSGYITTAGGEPLVFSIIVNGVSEVPKRLSLIDEMVTQLAGYNGRID
ncbi:MAG TPA: D-alanyl-D-alanine carboxypeptidase/D-alanyl-D-alanine-endopeptidase [Pyrinomonadaceae bacterium]|nr:D-alanyl-D-alanine carboxypeptidase/D-alanyl-D-alanine-endopeptidase [Pyrinomonadaceae bacterium]